MCGHRCVKTSHIYQKKDNMTRMPKSKSYGKKRHMWILKWDHLFSWKISTMYKRLQAVQQNTYVHSLLESFKNLI